MIWPDSLSQQLIERTGLQQMFGCLTAGTARALLCMACLIQEILIGVFWYYVLEIHASYYVLEIHASPSPPPLPNPPLSPPSRLPTFSLRLLARQYLGYLAAKKKKVLPVCFCLFFCCSRINTFGTLFNND